MQHSTLFAYTDQLRITCPADFVYNMHGNICFKLYTEKLSRADASTVCKNLRGPNARLVVLNTPERIRLVQEHVSAHYRTQSKSRGKVIVRILIIFLLYKQVIACIRRCSGQAWVRLVWHWTTAWVADNSHPCYNTLTSANTVDGISVIFLGKIALHAVVWKKTAVRNRV